MKKNKSESLQKFIGREYELRKLGEIASGQEASIIVVHGRRRVGKTELIEHAFDKVISLDDLVAST